MVPAALGIPTQSLQWLDWPEGFRLLVRASYTLSGPLFMAAGRSRLGLGS